MSEQPAAPAGAAGAASPSEDDPARVHLAPDLEIRVSDLRDNLGGYTTTIVEVDERAVWVGIPFRRDGMLDLRVGEMVSVRFDREGDAAYLFNSVVAEVRPDDRAPFGLSWPTEFDRRPHRLDVRLAMVLDATYSRGLNAGQAYDAKIVDLSAGGLGLITDVDLEVGEKVGVRFRLPEPQGPVAVDCSVVVRSRAIYGRTPSGNVLYQFGVQFIELAESIREGILSSVIWNLTRNPSVL